MTRIDRREFLRRSVLTSMGMGLGASSSHLRGAEVTPAKLANTEALIPIPIQVVIDDVGWWSGQDDSTRQGPYRTGINRNHVPADYQAIVDMGRALGIRPQAAMVLCEWDRENILRDVPTSTWQGKQWDNSQWVGPWLDRAAEIIRNNSAHFEFTIHGLGHEYWSDGTFTRAEWADKNGIMRPRDQVELHLDYFGKLMEQNHLGSFPKSFVPTAFRHGFGRTPGHDLSMAAILKQRGVNYINTPFRVMRNQEEVQYGVFGIDAGVMTVDRGRDQFTWYVFGAQPVGTAQGPTCGLHWPNMLHPDPDRNSEVVGSWVTYLAPFNERLDTLLAPDSVAFQRQFAHQACTQLSLAGNRIELDFTKTNTLPDRLGKREFTLKVKDPRLLQFSSQSIEIASISVKESESCLHSLVLKRKPGASKAQIRFTQHT
ncbi:MAG: hypothetical protein ACYSUY_17465 [Planctomycetota bacterium]